MPSELPQPRLGRGEFLTAVWALALLVSMFALKWYGIDNLPGRNVPQVGALDAFTALSIVRWLMLATILLAVGSVALHLTQGDHGTQTDTSRVLAWACTVVALLLVYRVLIALPDSAAVVDQKLGALVGLGCALAMTASAWQARRSALAAARAGVVRHRRRRAAPVPAPSPSPADAPADASRPAAT